MTTMISIVGVFATLVLGWCSGYVTGARNEARWWVESLQARGIIPPKP